MVAIVGEAEQRTDGGWLRLGRLVGRAIERKAAAFDATDESGQVGGAEVQCVLEVRWTLGESEVRRGELQRGQGDGVQATVTSALCRHQAAVAEGQAAGRVWLRQVQCAGVVELADELHDRQQADAGQGAVQVDHG